MLSKVKNDNKNLRNIYFGLDDIMYQLLAKYNDNSFVEDPSVPIRAIALENGIKEIIPVSPKEIHYERAFLDNDIIKLNDQEKDEKKNHFLIAHELKHFLLGDQEYYKKQEMILKKPYIVYEKPEVKVWGKQAAKYADISDSEKSKNAYEEYFDRISPYIAEIVSNNMGKTVNPRKANIIINKLYTYYSEDKNNDDIKVREYVTSEYFITDSINKLYDEELADYFAANLLVPTDRFILWEDKEDEEISKAFKVTIECIKKRREEIEHEIEFTTITSLSSGN